MWMGLRRGVFTCVGWQPAHVYHRHGGISCTVAELNVYVSCVCCSTRQHNGVSGPVRRRYRIFYKSHPAGQLRLPVSQQLSSCQLYDILYTAWPNKNRAFFEIPYFCSLYRYNHAFFAEVLRNYSRKQQVTIFLNEC